MFYLTYMLNELRRRTVRMRDGRVPPEDGTDGGTRRDEAMTAVDADGH